jgi:hypothetical protein
LEAGWCYRYDATFSPILNLQSSLILIQGLLIDIVGALAGSKTPIHGIGAFARFPTEFEGASCEVVAYFDLESIIPCTGLVIDKDNALLLKPKLDGKGKGRVDTWQRIGVATQLGQFGKSPINWDSELVRNLASSVTIE